MSDARALDVLLADSIIRTVQKKGIILEHRSYIARELGPIINHRVLVRIDEADAGRVYVFMHNAFVCVAQCPELTGVSRAQIAQDAKLDQRAALREFKRGLKRGAPDTSAGAIHAEIAADAAHKAAQVVPFRAAGESYSTPDLDEASKAARAADAKAKPVAPDPDREERNEKFMGRLQSWVKEQGEVQPRRKTADE